MRRFALLRVVLLCAVLVANNLHLPLLQVTAWARMLFSYSQENSVATAIEMTFDGEHPCPMCKKIQKAEGSSGGDRLSAPADGKSREGAYPLVVATAARPPAFSLCPFESAHLRCPEARAAVPPTPPPIAA